MTSRREIGGSIYALLPGVVENTFSSIDPDPETMTFQTTMGEQARLARRQMRRWQALLRWRRLSLAGTPVLFANSFPKSGTHLLTQVMHGFAQIGPAVDSGLPAMVTFDGFTGRQRTQAEILGDLQRLLPGDIAYGHVHAFPEAVELLVPGGHGGLFYPARPARCGGLARPLHSRDGSQPHPPPLLPRSVDQLRRALESQHRRGDPARAGKSRRQAGTTSRCRISGSASSLLWAGWSARRYWCCATRTS